MCALCYVEALLAAAQTADKRQRLATTKYSNTPKTLTEKLNI